ncbi:MAG: VanW family protein [Clostridia bacterium]|nr:VanW family protein [Clostridia bacterium]
MRGEKKANKKYRAFVQAAGAFLLSVWIVFPTEQKISAAAERSAPSMEERLSQEKQSLCLSRFTTLFDGQNQARSHNIRLACSLLDGCKVGGGEVFSFNQAVGERTKERGFAEAAIIKEGEFVLGTGGGVCQVSTTVYNAALLAGMQITEVRPHSLRVGYVSPSLDAMVSSDSDMRFKNPMSTPVVLRAHADENSLTVEVYGRQSGYTYQTQSVVLQEPEPPMPVIEEGETDEILREEKRGTVSESYLLVYRHGKRVGGKRIRRDGYAAVQGVLRRKKEANAEENEKQKENEEETDEENGEAGFDNKFEKFTQND